MGLAAARKIAACPARPTRALEFCPPASRIACGASTARGESGPANKAFHDRYQTGLELQRTMVHQWHSEPVGNPYDGFLGLVCQEHGFNFLLWHEEDIARSPDVADAQLAAVKRAIDGYNQKRNDAIEKLDDWLVEQLRITGVVASDSARLNTETPGSAIDRLSILALRIYHMDEQAHRTDASLGHRAKARSRLEILARQQHDLAQASRAAERHLCRPQAARSLPAVQDVQRSDAQPLPVRRGRAAQGIADR